MMKCDAIDVFIAKNNAEGLDGLEIQGSRVQTCLRSMGFFQDVKILSTSPPGGNLRRESRVWDFRLVKESHAEKIGPLAKFIRRIHVLVIP